MCDICGCTAGTDHVHVAGSVVRFQTSHQVEVQQSLLQANDHQAAHNRAHFAAAGVLVVNLMSSPGAGKTSLLEATIHALRGRLSIAVIEGDLETENDARRIRSAGAQAVQITTGNACHLDARMVHAALHALDLRPIDVLFIENVGNLVCPACFDLGQHRNVVLLSVTEGDDKPEKYPVMFRAADLMALTKLDLLEAVGDFDPRDATRHLRNLATAAPVLELSSRNGSGIDMWIAWIAEQVDAASHTTGSNTSGSHTTASPAPASYSRTSNG
jgi:hydrogenase nickel incorporation protein HypB